MSTPTDRSAPGGATLPDPLDSDDEDAGQVAAALADAAHAGGLSDAYYRKADQALRRLFARLHAAEGEAQSARAEVDQAEAARCCEGADDGE